MKKILKNKKGITLVALVVTIVILLILAGISISTLTNTGIFEKAKDGDENAFEKIVNRLKQDFSGGIIWQKRRKIKGLL